jgi:hypothetical protein
MGCFLPACCGWVAGSYAQGARKRLAYDSLCYSFNDPNLGINVGYVDANDTIVTTGRGDAWVLAQSRSQEAYSAALPGQSSLKAAVSH